jgi:hypothetical protein
MKKTIATFFFFHLALLLAAQTLTLQGFNENRLETNRKAMIVLGTWAAGNIATGAVLMGKKTGEDKYFHQMNLGWGAVNLGIATVGYLASMKADPAGFDTYSTVHEHFKMQKILLFNAGLDLGYMAGGFYLMERSKNTSNNPERLKGFGKSIVLQGAFLFAFDLTTYFFHAKNNEKLRPLLDGLSFTGDGFSWEYYF